MDKLKIPYGCDVYGNLISADQVAKDEEYTCPCCGMKLVHRAGDMRVKHFSHPSGSNCSLESILHIIAKKLIIHAVHQNAVSQKVISLRHHCKNCGVEKTIDLPHQTFWDAQDEVKIGKYVCDVVAFKADDESKFAIEILNTHEVDARKANNLDGYWIELKADDVLINPYRWCPTQSRLKDIVCSDCKNHFNHIIAVAEKWGIDRKLYSPVKDPDNVKYIASIETCFACEEEIPVFWWRGVPFSEESPPEPKPKTIQYRYSKQYGGKYWANTCAKCRATQGDNYLYFIGRRPLAGLPLKEVRDERKTGLTVRAGSSITADFMRIVNRNIPRS